MYLQIVTIVALSIASLACGYHLLMVVCGQPRRRSRSPHKFPRIAVLVPAHNEACEIATTVRSVWQVDYPREQLRMLVVADNCTDATAAIARAEGAEALERIDPDRRGKGYALEFGLQALEADPPEIVFILDADCELTPGCLQQLAVQYERGADVVQGHITIRNPDESPSAYVVAVGQALDNALGLARSRMGLPVTLRGSGMAFRWKLLQAIPWTAYGLTEDAEYSERLAAQGVRIICEPGMGISMEAPNSTGALCGQRRRWRAALFTGQTHPVQRWLHSKPAVLAQLALAIALAGVTTLVLNQPAYAIWAGGLLLAGVLPYAWAMAVVGKPWQRVRLLAQAPVIVTRLLVVTVAGFFQKETLWQRTRRNREVAVPLR